MFRDFWKMKVQFIAVFLLAFLAVFCYTGLEGVWYGTSNYAEEFLDKSNAADAWVQGYQMTSNDIDKIKDLKGIKTAQATSTLKADVEFNNKEAQLLLMASPENELSRPKIMEGEKYSPEETGIWLYQNFAKQHQLKIGDTIEVESDNNQEKRMKIRGLVMSPEYFSYTGNSLSIIPDNKKYGYAFISPKSLEKLSGKPLAYNQIKIKYEKDTSIQEVRNDIEGSLGNKYLTYSDRTDFKGISSFTDKFEQIRMMSIFFSVFLILLAVLTVQSTMKRMIETQRTQIGTLKALGYQNWKIRLHYLFYGFWISLAGGLVGLVIAPLTISQGLVNMQKNFFSLPEWRIENSIFSIVILLLVILICSVTALLASRKGIKGMPALTMREEPPKAHKPILLERFTGFWNLLSYEWRWTFRAIAKNKARTIMGIIGIMGSLALLMDGFGLLNSMQNSNNQLYGKQFDYGAKITLRTSANQANKDELYQLANENAQWLQESQADVRTAKNRSNGVLQIYDKGIFQHLKNAKGEIVHLPDNGLVLSRRFAQDMGVKENDTIQFRSIGYDNYMTARVDKIVPVSAPQGIFMSATFWKNLQGNFEANVLLAEDKELAKEVHDYSYVSETITLDKQLDQAEEVTGSIMFVIISLIVSAVLISIIILYNLGALSFTERSREYATLKVIGYREKEIRAFIRNDSLFQLFSGLILGVPTGYLLLNFHLQIGSSRTFEYVPYLSPYYLAFVIAFVSLLTMIISTVVSRKARKINTVEALKSVE